MMPATSWEWILALIGLVIGTIYAFDGWTSTTAAKSLKDSPRLVNFKYVIGTFFLTFIADFSKVDATIQKGRLLQIYLGWFVVTTLLVIIVVAVVIGLQFRTLSQECQGIQFPGFHPALHFLMYGYRSADEKLKEAKANWSGNRVRFFRHFLPDYNKQLTHAIVAVSHALHVANRSTSRSIAGMILQNIEAVVISYNEEVQDLKIAVNYMRAQAIAAVTPAEWDDVSFKHGKRDDYEYVLFLEQYVGDPMPPGFALPVWKKDGGKEHVLPGAPQAFFNNGAVLVNDTKKLDFPARLTPAIKKAIGDFFVEKSYNSFLSMPIISNGAACGVLNIEADHAVAFGHDKAAHEEIIKMLNPFCHLLGFLIRT